MTPFVRDLLILIVGAGAPAGLALLFTWRSLARGKTFWMTIAKAEFAIFALAFAVTWGLTLADEQRAAKCAVVSGADIYAAGECGETLSPFALPLFVAVAVYFVGALVIRFAACKRAV